MIQNASSSLVASSLRSDATAHGRRRSKPHRYLELCVQLLFIYFHVRIYTVNVGLAVGLSVGLFFFLVCCVGVPICIALCVVHAANRRHPTVRTDVVATTPRGRTTVVTANQATATSAPIVLPSAPVVQPPLQQHKKPRPPTLLPLPSQPTPAHLHR